jgi:hypothetical protein
MKKTGELILCQILAFSAILQECRQHEFQFNVRLLLRRQAQKLTCGANLPSSFFQSCLLAFSHGSTQLVVRFESFLAHFNNSLRSLLRLLAKHFQDHNCILVYSKHDSPGISLVSNPEFVTSRTNRRHSPRLWQAKSLSLLELPQQEACFEPCSSRKGRSFHLAFEPDERLFPSGHCKEYMSYVTYCQEQILGLFHCLTRACSCRAAMRQ